MAEETPEIPAGPLRSGWTTGACATAATRAAYQALLGAGFPDPVETPLPRGRRPQFALVVAEEGDGWAQAGVVKDAGDDPDVTHGITVLATVRHASPGEGVNFRAGEGVGTVTLPGLPIPVGEPAINPAPRRMMAEAVAEVAARFGGTGDVLVEIAIPSGEEVAQRTWNPRLGIVGGLSILGTTGVVVPYSCSAWIHSIHRGIDVARALGLEQVAGCTGSTSEAAVQGRFGLPDVAMLDMGDFAGGMLTYVRRHPVPRLTIGGGFAKLSKLAAGHLDLHSSRSQVDLARLAAHLEVAGAPPDAVQAAASAHTALELLQIATGAGVGAELADRIGRGARDVVARALGEAPVTVGIVVVDRDGTILSEVT